MYIFTKAVIIIQNVVSILYILKVLNKNLLVKKRFVFLFLKVSRVFTPTNVDWKMVSMFLAAFRKYLLPYATPHVCGTVRSCLDSDLGDLSVDGQSYAGLYLYIPVSCTVTCM